MDQEIIRGNKLITVGFLTGAQVIIFMIRFALPIAAPTLMTLYGIDPKTMGYILSGWNWSYTSVLLFAGPVVDWIGPWLAMGLGSIVWGLSTLALPLAGTMVGLFAMRLVFGLGQGILIPSTAASVSRLFTPGERTRALAVAFSGNQVGLAAGAGVATFILVRLGWEAIFYVMGGISLMLTLAWFVFYPDKRVGRIGTQAAPSTGTQTEAPQRFPWRSLFRFRSTWGLALGQFGYLYSYFFFIAWLPGYLVLERNMTDLRSGFSSALVFIVGMVGTLGGGWLGDYLLKRGMDRTRCRKSIIGGGLAIAFVLVVAAAYVVEAEMAVALLAVGVGFMRLATGSVHSLPLELAPKQIVASLASVQNFSGNVGGLLAPILSGYLVQQTGSFESSVVVAGVMALLGAVGFVFLVGELKVFELSENKSVQA